MRLSTLAFPAILFAVPGLVGAQGAPAGANPAVAAVRGQYEQTKGYLLRSVDQMPEADYSFRPTPEVRTFGQIVGHLANDQYQFCSAALGEKNPAAGDFEKTATTKAALSQAIRASFTYCDRAYQITDQQATRAQGGGGQQRTPLDMLALNAVHNAEHYGNFVTYMRIKGMVPPSSQPRQ